MACGVLEAPSEISAKESMPQGVFKNLLRCSHFVDAWDKDDDKNWDDIYAFVKEELSKDT